LPARPFSNKIKTLEGSRRESASDIRRAACASSRTRRFGSPRGRSGRSPSARPLGETRLVSALVGLRSEARASARLSRSDLPGRQPRRLGERSLERSAAAAGGGGEPSRRRRCPLSRRSGARRAGFATAPRFPFTGRAARFPEESDVRPYRQEEP
jgi:hypothetical protein